MRVKNNAIFENLAYKQIYALFIYAFLSIKIKKHLHSKKIVYGSDDFDLPKMAATTLLPVPILLRTHSLLYIVHFVSTLEEGIHCNVGACGRVLCGNKIVR